MKSSLPLSLLFSGYQRVLKRPSGVLAIIALAVLVAAYHARNFTFDASSDTLVAENDPALTYYQDVRERFTQGGEGFLFMTYTPKLGELVSEEHLSRIAAMQKELETIPGVASVYSILDAPLLKSPKILLNDLKDGYKTLKSPSIDFALAKKELSTSPIFKDLIISTDGRTTALRIGLGLDTELEQLRKKRDEDRIAFRKGEIEKQQLDDSTAAHLTARKKYLAQRDDLLEAVREVRDHARKDADVFLGGVPMVAADMISYVKQDIVIFSAIIFLVVIAMLYLFFRSWRWVVLPLATSVVTIVLVIGWLGAIEKPATIISSNFISLLAILTISFTVHLIVRYREILATQLSSKLNPEHSSELASHHDIVLQTMRDKFAPSLYTGLTTTVAFASLMFTDIVPVQDFGLLMLVGVLVSLVMTYFFFPSLLLFLGKDKDNGGVGDSAHSNDKTATTPRITTLFSQLVTHHSQRILVVAGTIFIIAGFGISKLSLDNRFIDYFKADTDIRQGMLDIDQRLGGTLPFDVIVKFPPYKAADELEEDDDFFSDEEAYPERYWVTPDKLETLRKLQSYIQSLEQTGKVMSLANLEQVAMEFLDGKPLGALEIVGILGVIPETIRAELVDPYLSPYSGEMLISVRVKESGASFSREDYLNKIKSYATNELGLQASDVQTTGMLVLFNNMLTHLFDSQLRTFLYVVGLIFIMIWILMRSIRLGIIGLAPNMLAAVSVLAVMGFLNIPLDLMTITIAAIVIGIGVDNAIHYLHRFKLEYKATGDVQEAVRRSHRSIGSAIYFTSLTIIAGFTILAFSNFMPTVYFGLFTSLAMLLALMANLMILPSLLVKFYR
ncbi:MAG: MMPL family transporter [Thiotrichaceae bacterium]